MEPYGLEILTPMDKLERVTRSIDPTNFFAITGIWAQLNNDGSLSNVVTNTPAKVNKMIIGSRTDDMYEGNDTLVGRIATMESVGARCKANTYIYSGTINPGDRLVISTNINTCGKLISAELTSESGSYEVVARCEEANMAQGQIVFRTICPEIVVLPIDTTTTTTAAPTTTTTTAAPTTTTTTGSP